MTLNSDRESLAISEGYSESAFSRMIKAGHRTYFIDVKTTRQDDYYLSITELRKKITRQGEVVTERNKVFVYQEDIDKFTDSMAEVVEYLRKHAKCPTNTAE